MTRPRVYATLLGMAAKAAKDGVTRTRVRELTDKGLNPREIAGALRLSTQAVYRHLKKLDEEADNQNQQATA